MCSSRCQGVCDLPLPSLRPGFDSRPHVCTASALIGDYSHCAQETIVVWKYQAEGSRETRPDQRPRNHGVWSSCKRSMEIALLPTPLLNVAKTTKWSTETMSELLAGLDSGAEGVEGGEQTCDSGCEKVIFTALGFLWSRLLMIRGLGV